MKSCDCSYDHWIFRSCSHMFAALAPSCHPVWSSCKNSKQSSRVVILLHPRYCMSHSPLGSFASGNRRPGIACQWTRGTPLQLHYLATAWSSKAARRRLALSCRLSFCRSCPRTRVVNSLDFVVPPSHHSSRVCAERRRPQSLLRRFVRQDDCHDHGTNSLVESVEEAARRSRIKSRIRSSSKTRNLYTPLYRRTITYDTNTEHDFQAFQKTFFQPPTGTFFFKKNSRNETHRERKD